MTELNPGETDPFGAELPLKHNYPHSIREGD